MRFCAVEHKMFTRKYLIDSLLFGVVKGEGQKSKFAECAYARVERRFHRLSVVVSSLHFIASQCTAFLRWNGERK